MLFQRGSPEGPGSAAHGSSRQDGRKHHQLPQDGAAVNHLLGADEGPDILTSGRAQHGHGQHDQGEYTYISNRNEELSFSLNSFL